MRSYPIVSNYSISSILSYLDEFEIVYDKLDIKSARENAIG